MRIGYARVSTDDQSLNLQLDALRAAGCTRIFTDKLSGRNRNRPGLDRACKAMKPGDTIVVWRLDRLGRSLMDLIELVSTFQHKGCEFRSLMEAIDTATAGGKLVFHIMGALAEFERRLISERTMAGLKAARARGTRLGRRPRLSQAQLHEARRMVGSGEGTVAEIAKRMSIGR
jgi:DNA invertase Pin-like site-specific DNA recombinase